MASPNAPKSSEQLIREHSTARYLSVGRGYRDPNALPYTKSAVDQQARKYR